MREDPRVSVMTGIQRSPATTGIGASMLFRWRAERGLGRAGPPVWSRADRRRGVSDASAGQLPV
jgi:hypothetical protein